MDSKVQKVLGVLEKDNAFFWPLVGIIAIGFLGLLDYLTGIEFSFSLFYIAPVILVAWATNLGVGIFVSIVAALTLLGAEIAGGQVYSLSIIYFLNTTVRALSYITLAYLVVELKKSQLKEHAAARTDFITGIANRRHFHELLEMEVERIRRYPHPITIVYMDMDNFKMINDLFGHMVGDEVLRSIARELKIQLRKTDVVARLGGDEFALLLPSTRLADAQALISRLRNHLTEKMRQKNLPITISMGVVVCQAPPHSVENLVDMADELMYEVKNSTKNNTLCAAWDGQRFHKVDCGFA